MSLRFKDLSRHSKPIGNFIKTLPTKSEWNQYRLSTQQLLQYQHFGFVSNVHVLSSVQVATLLNDYSTVLNAVNTSNDAASSSWSSSVDSNDNVDNDSQDILSLLHEYHSNETGDDENILFHCLGHWRVCEGFHDLIFHPRVTVPCAQLLYIDAQRHYAGNDNHRRDHTEHVNINDHEYVDEYDEVCVRFWHDQLFAKPPNCGGNVAWHQDYSYWTRTHPMQHITCHIALDKQSKENGAIAYVPGSHEWYRTDEHGEILPLPITDKHFIDMDSIFDTLTQQEKHKWTVEICHLEPGQAVFHNALTVHGSYPNRSKNARRACVLNYFKDGTYSNTDEALLRGMPVVPKGHKLQTMFNPIVYDPVWKGDAKM